MKYFVCVIFFLAISASSWAEERKEECIGVADSFPCHLSVISWVEVGFQGELLKENKEEFEKLIRLRLRNDLSMYNHEVKKYTDMLKENDYEFEDRELLRRGSVYCFIWTVGDDYPVAFYVECNLSGWGSYKVSLYKSFESRILGYASSKTVKEQVDESIRSIIGRLSLLDKYGCDPHITSIKEGTQPCRIHSNSSRPSIPTMRPAWIKFSKFSTAGMSSIVPAAA
jgi:hypothetical protein